MINNQVCVSGKDVAGFMHINGKEISLYVGDKVLLGNSNIVATTYADEESIILVLLKISSFTDYIVKV